MTLSTTLDGINYGLLNTAEQIQWKNHRSSLLAIPEEESGYRGCIGLSLIVKQFSTDSLHLENGKQFIRNDCLSWASITDIPRGYFRLSNRKREVHWATIRPITVRFGVPMLARGTEEGAWDFRTIPLDLSTVDAAHYPDVLDARRTQLFRVFNAIEMSMTSTAFSFRSAWAPQRQSFYSVLGKQNDLDKPALAFGVGIYDAVDQPHAWMPRPYLAFPLKARNDVYDWATRQTLVDGVTSRYNRGLRSAFVYALGACLEYKARFDGFVQRIGHWDYRGIPTVTLVLRGYKGEYDTVRFFGQTAVLHRRRNMHFKEGEVLGEERLAKAIPENWYELSEYERWKHVPALVGRRLDSLLRLWFEREAVFATADCVHYPSQLASNAALNTALDSELLWDISPALDYYSDDVEACVFPTLQIRHWYDLSGSLPGDVAYDLQPSDQRYESLQEQHKRTGKESTTRRPKR